MVGVENPSSSSLDGVDHRVQVDCRFFGQVTVYPNPSQLFILFAFDRQSIWPPRVLPNIWAKKAEHCSADHFLGGEYPSSDPPVSTLYTWRNLSSS